MSWEEIEDGVQSAVAAASGLPPEKVYWSHQDWNEETDDYVVISFGGALLVGQDWVKRTTDLTRPNGQEILEQVHGMREVPLQIECFSASVLGSSAARQRADLIRSRLRLEGIRSRFRRAHVSPFDSGQVSSVPDILAAKFRGRATVTVRCYVPVLDVYDYVGYIARIKGTAYVRGLASPTGATAFPFDSLQASGMTGFRS